MVVTFVLRLVAEHLREGAFAGEVHVVPSGERVTVHNGDDLLAVLMAGSARAEAQAAAAQSADAADESAPPELPTGA